jgi:hypothetical protein
LAAGQVAKDSFCWAGKLSSELQMTNGFTVVTAMLGAGFQRATGRYKRFLPSNIAERIQKIFDVIA